MPDDDLLQMGGDPPPSPAAPAGGDDDLLLLGGDPPPATAYVPFEQAFAAFLASIAGIPPAWHGVIPQKVGTAPAVVWQVVGGDSDYNLSGPSGLSWRTVQVKVQYFGVSPGPAWGWAETIRASLTGAPGRAAFQGAFAHGELSDTDPGVDSSGRSTHWHLREYTVFYPEPRA